jgi:iron complex transport system ATP-binding protein
MIRPEFRALEIVASGKGAILNPWQEAGPKEIERAQGLLDEAGLGHLAGREWEILSQGERQRVMFLRALMARPALLILDEPCSGLDPVARERFLNFVEGAASAPGGPAMVFVTHHVEEITPSFDRLLLIKKGRVLASGAMESVLTEHNLGETFGEPVRLHREGSRWRMEIV